MCIYVIKILLLSASAGRRTRQAFWQPPPSTRLFGFAWQQTCQRKADFFQRFVFAYLQIQIILIWSPCFFCWTKGCRQMVVGPTGCRPYNGFFLLLLQSLSRSALKHQHFHDSSIAINISYMVGKRTAPGFIWRWQRQRQRHTQRQIQGQRQSFQEESLPVYINLVILRSNRYL